MRLRQGEKDKKSTMLSQAHLSFIGVTVRFEGAPCNSCKRKTHHNCQL